MSLGRQSPTHVRSRAAISNFGPAAASGLRDPRHDSRQSNDWSLVGSARSNFRKRRKKYRVSEEARCVRTAGSESARIHGGPRGGGGSEFRRGSSAGESREAEQSEEGIERWWAHPRRGRRMIAYE